MIPADESGHGGGDRYAEWDAAYVLGALSPSDRRAYERHLAECAACRAAVAELAGMPGLLSTLSPAHAEALVAETPGTDLLGGGLPASPGAGPGAGLAPVVPLASLAGAARRSRRRRRSLSAVAACALLVAGVAGGSVLTDSGFLGDGPGTAPSAAVVAGARTIELRPVGDADMRAELVVTPTTWGTSLRWSCHYPPEPGRRPPAATYTPSEPIRYELVLVGRDGARTVAGTWSWSGGVTTGLDASSAVPLTEVDRIEITLDGHEEALAAATL
jgi:hypothetical protein